MNETEKIMETINAYLTAIKSGAEDDFRRAFYWNAVVITANGDNPEESAVPIQAFMEKIQTRNKEGQGGEEIAHGITISHVGGAANVRLDFELVFPGMQVWGTDFFNMVKTRGQWKITQKIYAVTH